MNSYVAYSNIVPLIAPVDTAATALASPFVDMSNAHELAFVAFFGVVTTGTADSNVTMTVEASSAASSGAEVTVPFVYRLSGAVGANTWGAATTASTAGCSVASTDDSKMIWIQIDPAAMLAELAGAQYVRLVITPTADHTVTLVGAWAEIAPRYRQVTYVSAT